MSVTKRTQRARWSIFSRLVPILVLLIATIFVSVGAANASLPVSAPLQPPKLGHPTFTKGQPLENGPAIRPAPPFATAPSGPFAIDPHWRANVKANTDSTSFAQQEPSI